MNKRALLLASALAVGLFSAHASLQVAQKGGEDETGPYDVVKDWPKPWSAQGYIWGSQPGILAESPNRVFVLERGEIKLPDKPMGRGFNGNWGSTGERASVPKAEPRNCIVVLDSTGKMIESWTQWDHLFETGSGPHKIRISPYDPEHHVWIVNDSRQVIYEFSNDGKQLLKTLGETDKQGDDETHFGQPQDLAFLPDGSIVIADGLRNARIVKLDKNGKFLKQWGTRGNGEGQLSGPHGIATSKDGKVYVADRGNHRVQVFDADGKHLDTWPNILFPNSILIPADQKTVWVLDGDNHKILQYDPNGKLLYSWGTFGVNGTNAGEFWEMHDLSVDTEGNLYIADSFGGKSTKLRPRPGVDKSKLVAMPLALMPKK
jgi:DNA-binding beta-propeller fold protein YncE